MTRVAIYLRYSCNQQKDTSLEDQERRCRELAVRHGFSLDGVRIFKDAALSGTSKHDEKREGFQQLLKAWDKGEIDVVLVDEFSRLTRDAVQQALITQRLNSNHRVCLLTVNGIDTRVANWQLSLGLMGLVGQQAVRDTQSRVVRGMYGQLERGFMIAFPPFGYEYERKLDERGNKIGTHWTINDAKAAIVQAVFERRGAGYSMHQIARWLNEQGIPCGRAPRSPAGGIWRPARVKNMLSNPIYRGVFIWNGSENVRLKARKEGRDIEPKIFDRSALRLVSDELWYRCQSKKISRSGYGGGKHVLAGMVSCGYCNGILAIGGVERCRSLHCPNCVVTKAVCVAPDRLTVTVAVKGVELLLQDVLRACFSPAGMESYREQLRFLLEGDHSKEIEALEKQLRDLRGAQERLSHMLLTQDDPLLQLRYGELRDLVKKVEGRLESDRVTVPVLDVNTINKQLETDPQDMLAALFDGSLPSPEVRSVLARLFPSIIYEGKDGRYTSFFRIKYAPGVALAIASQSAIQDASEIEVRYALKYSPTRVADKEGRWTVSLLGMAESQVQVATC